MYSKTCRRSPALVGQVLVSMSSRLMVAKKLSAAALSHPSGVRTRLVDAANDSGTGPHGPRRWWTMACRGSTRPTDPDADRVRGTLAIVWGRRGQRGWHAGNECRQVVGAGSVTMSSSLGQPPIESLSNRRRKSASLETAFAKPAASVEAIRMPGVSMMAYRSRSSSIVEYARTSWSNNWPSTASTR
jgi:hypothetical protein